MRNAGHAVHRVSTNLDHPQNDAISQISDIFVMVAPLFRSCPYGPTLSPVLGRKGRIFFDVQTGSKRSMAFHRLLLPLHLGGVWTAMCTEPFGHTSFRNLQTQHRVSWPWKKVKAE